MNNHKVNLILNVTRIALIVIGVIATLMVISGRPEEGAEKAAVEAFRDGGTMSFTMGFALAIIIASVAAVLLFFLLQLVTDSKRTITSILPLLIALVFYLILSLVGSGDTWQTIGLKSAEVADQGTISGVTAGIWTVMIGLVVSVLAILFTRLIGSLRK